MSIDPIQTFAKQVKSTSIARKSISDVSTISKLLHVLHNLESQSKAAMTLASDLGLKTNPKKWASSLISGYPSAIAPDDAESLLFDFTESMQTRMRMETKYALALVLENKVFLAHSVYGQETVTPEWRIIPRMLDIDNVLRFASFFKEDGDLYVRYWERNATSSFIQWLGLPRKQAYLFGGTFRILSSIEGATIEIQLTEDEIQTWIDRHPELAEGKISFDAPVHGLAIQEIRAGSKTYDHAGDFIQDFEAQKRGLPKYQREYESISAKTAPMFVKYYDEKHQLVAIQDEQVSIEVEKTSPGIDIFFANGIIEFRSSYVSDLVNRISNGEEVNIFHAGHDFSIQPIEIGRVRIYNRLKKSPTADALLEYISRIQIQDRQLANVLKLAALLTLGTANEGTPLGYAIAKIAAAVHQDLQLTGTLSKLEDGTLEYKSRDILAGRNDQVIQVLSEDLSTALKRSNMSILLVGVRDDGTIDPVPQSRIGSDRLESIRMGLAAELKLAPPHMAAIAADGGSIVMICCYP